MYRVGASNTNRREIPTDLLTSTNERAYQGSEKYTLGLASLTFYKHLLSLLRKIAISILPSMPLTFIYIYNPSYISGNNSFLTFVYIYYTYSKQSGLLIINHIKDKNAH